MIIGVFGPRDYKGAKYDNYDHVASTLAGYDKISLVISGGGNGVEQMASRFAEAGKIENIVIPPNISAVGQRDAFIHRNLEIINKVDLCVVFWDGVDAWYSKLLGSIVHNGKPSHVYPL